MASWVISECGLRPLPRISQKPRTRIPSNPIKLQTLHNTTDPGFGSTRISNGRFRSLEVKVSAPLSVVSTEDGEERMRVNKEESEFDPGSPPPFNLGDVRAAIPKHCWVKNPWRLMSYVVRDVVVVFGLAVAAVYVNNWFVWPLYWAAQGTMFWALFVLGHDCGHGSFSNNPKLNGVVGHILHSSILVPYHGMLSERIYKTLDRTTQMLLFTLPFPLLAYPFYLWNRSPGKTGSHFEPSSDLFVLSEKKDVITSTVCWTAMAALLVGLSFVLGPIQMLKLYGIPYVVSVMWLDFVTYLHHHGHEDKLPWYRGKTEAAKPVFGKYYREPKKSGPLPFHLLGSLITRLKKNLYVSDSRDVVYYQTDLKLK